MNRLAWLFLALFVSIRLIVPDNSFGYAEGPDSYGYSYADSSEANGPEYSFTDIKSYSDSCELDGDAMSDPIPIGFNFYFYGNKYSELYISSNGFITFDRGWGTGCCNGEQLPSSGSIDNVIAGIWDDLDPAG